MLSPSTLFIIPTPIGNLGDITLRAVATLQSVDIIACEDTRVTRRLLTALAIEAKKLISYHNFNEALMAKKIIALLQGGASVALVSDAGMPGINDPGFALVKLCWAEHIKIDVLPGPSAVISAVVLANFSPHFTFLGFLRPKTLQRQNDFKKLVPGTYVCFVTPHNVMAVLKDLQAVFGPELLVFAAREMTKKFETHYRGLVADVLIEVGKNLRGEYTLVFTF